jgi:hypothetical protein
MKDELFNLKDDLRRQIEESHLVLKKTFSEFTSQIDSFSQTVELERAAVSRASKDVNDFYARLD